MLEALTQCAAIQSGRDGASLTSDSVEGLAICKLVVNIGEASSRVSAKFREEVPHVDWSGPVALRNVVVHRYWDIDMSTVEVVLSREFPRLGTQLRLLLAS